MSAITNTILTARVLFMTASNAVRRKLKVMPIQLVLRDMAERGIKVRELVALEVFGGEGCLYTQDLAEAVASIEAWEIDPARCKRLAHRIPSAKVRVTDSFKEMKTCNKQFSLVSSDNHQSNFGREKEYCEHFDIFPDIFRLVMDPAVLILNVIPKAGPVAKRLSADLFNDRQLARRREFYGTETPENISIEEMMETYARLARESKFCVDWWFARRRTLFVHFLVISISKIR